MSVLQSRQIFHVNDNITTNLEECLLLLSNRYSLIEIPGVLIVAINSSFLRTMTSSSSLLESCNCGGGLLMVCSISSALAAAASSIGAVSLSTVGSLATTGVSTTVTRFLIVSSGTVDSLVNGASTTVQRFLTSVSLVISGAVDFSVMVSVLVSAFLLLSNEMRSDAQALLFKLSGFFSSTGLLAFSTLFFSVDCFT